MDRFIKEGNIVSMGMMGGPPAGVSQKAIIAEAKRQIRDLEGRLVVTRESVTILENAVASGGPLDSRSERVERMLEAIIQVQLTALRGNLTEGEIKLDEMSQGVAQAESRANSGLVIPVPPGKRFS